MNDMGEVMALIILFPLLSVYWAFTFKAVWNILRHGDPFPND